VNKKENRKHLAIDVTSLVRWERPPVGIVRTLLEFVKYNCEKVDSTIYFHFTHNRADIIQMGRSDVDAMVQRLLNYSFDSKPKSSDSKPVASAPAGKISKGIAFYKAHGGRALSVELAKRYLPAGIKNMIAPVYWKLFPKVVVGENSDIPGLEFNEKAAAENIEVEFLSENSTVVSMGLDWDFSNYPVLYWLKKRIGFEFVGTFYDGIAVNSPELVRSFGFSQMFFKHLYYLLQLSDRIFCISDCSKRELEEICDKHDIVDRPVFQTIHLGDSVKESRGDGEVEFANRGHKDKYAIFVSTIEVRKNHKLLFKVWDELRKDKSFDLPDLVCVGMIGWGVDDTMDIYNGNKELQKHVHIYSDVGDAELEKLYENSMFTVFPSFSEGWGLGAIESIRYGKPCLIADGCALREATQGLMPSFSPNDEKAWAEAVRRIASDASYMKELKSKIDNEFVPRTWEEFSIDFYQFAAGER